MAKRKNPNRRVNSHPPARNTNSNTNEPTTSSSASTSNLSQQAANTSQDVKPKPVPIAANANVPSNTSASASTSTKSKTTTKATPVQHMSTSKSSTTTVQQKSKTSRGQKKNTDAPNKVEKTEKFPNSKVPVSVPAPQQTKAKPARFNFQIKSLLHTGYVEPEPEAEISEAEANPESLSMSRSRSPMPTPTPKLNSSVNSFNISKPSADTTITAQRVEEKPQEVVKANGIQDKPELSVKKRKGRVRTGKEKRARWKANKRAEKELGESKEEQKGEIKNKKVVDKGKGKEESVAGGEKSSKTLPNNTRETTKSSTSKQTIEKKKKKKSRKAKKDGKKVCMICMEVPTRYGLLLKCEHAFCLGCIHTWRMNQRKEGYPGNYVHSHLDLGGSLRDNMCPVCRSQSDIVLPSKRHLTSPSEKEQLVVTYKESLAQRRCKHFEKFNEVWCPYGTDCLFSHKIKLDGSVMEFKHNAEQTRSGSSRAPRRFSTLSHLLSDLSGKTDKGSIYLREYGKTLLIKRMNFMAAATRGDIPSTEELDVTELASQIFMEIYVLSHVPECVELVGLGPWISSLRGRNVLGIQDVDLAEDFLLEYANNDTDSEHDDFHDSVYHDNDHMFNVVDANSQDSWV